MTTKHDPLNNITDAAHLGEGSVLVALYELLGDLSLVGREEAQHGFVQCRREHAVTETLHVVRHDETERVVQHVLDVEAFVQRRTCAERSQQAVDFQEKQLDLRVALAGEKRLLKQDTGLPQVLLVSCKQTTTKALKVRN